MYYVCKYILFLRKEQLSNPPFIQSLLIFPGIGSMLGISDRKVMSAGEIFLGTHVEVIVLGVVQDAFQSLVRRYTDRARRKSGILVSVVRRICFQVLVKDASKLEIAHAELYRRVGLEEHATLQAIDVEAGYHGLLGMVGGFFLYNGGKGSYLDGGKADGLGLLHAFLVPIGLVFLLHAGHEIFGTHVPVHFVGVRNEEGGEGFLRITHLSDKGSIVEQGSYFYRVNHELAGGIACHAVQGAHTTDGQLHGSLVTHREATMQVAHVVRGLDGVSSGLDVVALITDKRLEAVHLLGVSCLGDFGIYRVHIVVTVYIDIGSVRDLERLGKEVIIDVGDTCYTQYEDSQ